MSSQMTWQLLVVDDDPEMCQQIQEFLEGETTTRNEGLKIESTTEFDKALELLASRRFDIVIMDVRLGEYADNPAEEAGLKTLKEIQAKCFIPVLFHTGVSHLIRELNGPAIKVLTKDPGFPLLLQTINEIIDSKLPAVNRALIRHIEEIQRQYMWEFVVENWEQFHKTSDQASLAYLLARRLAISLSGTGIRTLIEDLGDADSIIASGNSVHPMQYYVMPPLQDKPLAGDLYKLQVDGKDAYRVLLTPSCDLHQGKADLALFARCELLTNQLEYESSRQSGQHNAKLKNLLKNNREKQADRFHFLPTVFTLPDLVVDFQQLETIPYQNLESLNRIASLDSPFAEALMARFTRYYGRLGTPDLNMDSVISRIKLDRNSIEPDA